ncbi:G-protein coupled receptors family 1 profile domain-containing protein [Caenorhabditis elegans]|uniref:G-protein coupled receptors family 1 profile domain-containing protein n=1 Tax=Caenorhabditis elegans TaxID=6239 RepID=O17023_CAEEL|nr:G-protein coupled receptors family 1 profile domain-containing protein [Caenorhabditis elegans]CCD71527.1 G-protein coupled receptors family 1 profile domain-containing protein [Caenorhabditis elegans]|eukprot:NP_503261.2 Serpentine Receptor, class W [Caenorhabditis elegans]
MNSEIHFNFIQKFQNVLNLLEKYAFLVQFILAIISFILNLLHFVIITRKSIRISSINCLMVGVTVCDICRMLTTIYRYLELEDLEYPECITVSSYIKAYLDITSWWLQDYFRRCSSWLDIFIANVRYIIMRKVSGARNSKTAQSKLGFILMTLVFCTSNLIQSMCLYSIQIVEKRDIFLFSNCAEHQDINKVYKYTINLRPIPTDNKMLLIRTYIFLDVIFSHFLPSQAFPILTVLLLRKIQKMEKSRPVVRNNRVAENNEDKHPLSTNLIIFLTISSFLADAPLGCIVMIKLFIPSGNRRIRFLTDLIVYLNILSTIIIMFRPILCFSMPRQYRNTAKKFFRVKNATYINVVPITK